MTMTTTTSCYFLATFLVLANNLFQLAVSRPEYQSRIPNGNQVPHPCARGQFWEGVGHQDPEGGGKPNPFGIDFYKANLSWTPALCRADSDGDGVSNGQELGDPNCVWQTGLTPTIRDMMMLTHPGVCEPLDSALCAGKNQWLIADYCPSLSPVTTPMSSSFVQCVPPTRLPTNAYVLNNSPSQGARYLTGDFIQYDCNIGYKMTGVPTIYCLRDGSWTDQPSCDVPSIIPLSRSSCGAVPVPDNGFVLTSTTQQSGRNYSTGDMVLFGCAPGYQIFGSTNVTCTRNGNWSTPRPMCISNSVIPVSQSGNGYCAAPTTPSHGYVSNRNQLQIYSQYNIGDILQYSCNSGYAISSKTGIQCQADGTWYPNVPTCIPVSRGGVVATSCPSPSVPENAFISRRTLSADGSDYRIGDVVTIDCNQGYRLANRFSSIQCLPDGSWQPNNFPSCIRNIQNLTGPSCSTPRAPEHGFIARGQSPAVDREVNYGLYAVGDEVLFSCIPGYVMVGTATIQCQSDGTWRTNQLPSCQRVVDNNVTCLSPFVPPNAVILTQSHSLPSNASRYIIGSFFLFGCSPGYVANPGVKATILCQKDGNWSPSGFCCVPLLPTTPPPVTCPLPLAPINAYIFASSPSRGIPRYYAVGDFIQYACLDGFTSDEHPVTVCQQSGIFQPPVNMNCVRLVQPQSGTATCISPSMPYKSSTVQLSPVRAGNRYSVGDTIQYACADGSSTSDPTILQCMASGDWFPNSMPNCVPNGKYSGSTIACVPPTIPDNSFVLNSAPTRQYYAGDVIQYGCADGYQVAGTSNRASCLNDGSWTTLFFVCQRQVQVSITLTTCNEPPPPTNGYMVSRSISLIGTRYSPNDYIQYACHTGYVLVGQSTSICNRDGSWSGAPACIRLNNNADTNS